MSKSSRGTKYFADFDPEGIPAVFMDEGGLITLVDFAKSIDKAKKEAAMWQKQKNENKTIQQ